MGKLQKVWKTLLPCLSLGCSQNIWWYYFVSLTAVLVFFFHFEDVPFGIFVKLQNPLLFLKCCKVITVSWFWQLLCEMPLCMCGVNAGPLLTPQSHCSSSHLHVESSYPFPCLEGGKNLLVLQSCNALICVHSEKRLLQGRWVALPTFMCTHWNTVFWYIIFRKPLPEVLPMFLVS